MGPRPSCTESYQRNSNKRKEKHPSQTNPAGIYMWDPGLGCFQLLGCFSRANAGCRVGRGRCPLKGHFWRL